MPCEPVEFVSTGDLFVNIIGKIDSVNRKIDLADGRDDLIVKVRRVKGFLQLALLLLRFFDGLIYMAKSHDDMETVLGLPEQGSQKFKILSSHGIWDCSVVIDVTAVLCELFHQILRLQFF